MIIGSQVKLNLVPSGVMPVVYINQGDAGYDKEFLIYNGDSPYNVPSGVSATIRGTKADGYGVTEAATVTTGSNLVTVTITEQMVAAAGANLYELVFVDTDGLRIATINMVWAVKPDALGDSVISDSDLDYATTVMNTLQSVQAFRNQLDANTSGLAEEIAARIAADDAERAARIAADNALQNGINAEASTRSSQDALLQSQINQLIAPSGTAPSAAEVQNARISADGITYTTLGDAIRTQVNELKSNINDLNEWDETAIKAGRKKRIFTKARIASILASGVQYITTGTRAAFEFVVPDTVDVYFTMPDTVGMRLAKMQSIGGALVGWVSSAYESGGAKKYNLSSDYSYCCVFLIGEGASNITDAQLELINETDIFIGDLSYEELRPIAFPQNILDGTTWEDGYYIRQDNGVKTANAVFSATDFIEVNQGRDYYAPIINIWFAWYDSSKRYISGGGYNDRTWVRPEVPYYTLTAPTNAKYIRFSLRLGDKASAILSEHKLSRNKAPESLVDAVPMSLAVRETPNTLYDYVFNTTAAPSMVSYMADASTVWEFTENGAKGVPSCVITPFDCVSIDRSIIRLLFSAESDFIFDFGYNSRFQGYITSDSGLKVTINSASDLMTIYRSDWQSANEVIATAGTGALDLTNGNIYILEIEKDTINHVRVRLYNSLTPKSIIEANIEATAGTGSEYVNQCRCWGVPYLAISSGTVIVKRMGMLSTAPAYPSIAAFGDSYIECYGRNPLCSYANRIKEVINGNIFISGKGGDKASDLLKRFPTELNLCYPKTIILNVGVNDSLNTTAADFFDNLNKLIALAETKNAEIILVTVPHIVTNTLNNADFVNSVNPIIRSMGYRYIDIAYALSTGDGFTPDTSKFYGDLVHPNISGGEAIFNQIKALMPDLLTQ